MKNSTNFEILIAEIIAEYGCNKEVVLELIAITNDMSSGAKFASIGGYSSDKSDHSEIAKHQILLGFSYANMKKDDTETLRNFNVNSVDVDRFNYDSIDLNGVSLTDYKNEVRNQLSIALNEIQNPKKRSSEAVNNDHWFNAILVFNYETKRLSIMGQEVKKTIIVEGEYKVTKSKPKTIAKILIKKQANLRADKIRRFAIDNLSEVKLNGENLEIQ